MSSHKHARTADDFWRWFVHSERRFRDLDVPSKESLLDEFLDELQAFCPWLYFAIGGDPGGPIELIVTASGNTHAFSCVKTLVHAAPITPGWKIIAFKPALGFDCVIAKGEAVLNPRACWFLPLPVPQVRGKVALRIACPGYSEAAAKDFAFAAWEALDVGLGELLAAERIENLEIVSAPENPSQLGYAPMPELERYLLSSAELGGV